jgi:gliding motility-associated-like protein
MTRFFYIFTILLLFISTSNGQVIKQSVKAIPNKNVNITNNRPNNVLAPCIDPASFGGTLISTQCEGNGIYLELVDQSTGLAFSDPAYVWSWTGPNGFTSSTNPTQDILNLTPANAGTYIVTMNTPGCPTYTETFLNLSIKPKKLTVLNPQMCQGQPYTYPDGSIANTTIPGTLPLRIFSLTSAGNPICVGDSVVNVTLNVKPTYNIPVAAKLCPGKTYTLPNGTTVNTAGIYPVTLTATNGCDSIVTTNLTAGVNATSTVNASLCPSKNYTLPSGTVVTTPGIYPVTLIGAAASGCDSIVTTNLTAGVNATSTVNASLCPGKNYTLPSGTVVTTPGIYPVTLIGAAASGCDSIVTTNLTAAANATSTVNASLCPGKTYTLPNGNVVTTTGIYPVALIGAAASGCDSIVTTNLTAGVNATSTVNAALCPGRNYTLPNGTVVTTAGTYPVTLVGAAASGCDSIVTVNLTAGVNATSTVNAALCPGRNYTLPNGTVVTTPGTYPVTLVGVAASGCDSIVTTNLTAGTNATSTVNNLLCPGKSYTLPNGTVVTTVGTYPVTLVGAAVSGCDSIVTTNLTAGTNATKTVNALLCSGTTYTLPNGTVVTTAGTYPVTLVGAAASGCDSIVTTILTGGITGTRTINSLLCTGKSYTLPNGTIVTTPGTYPVTLTGASASGCDSIVTTILTGGVTGRETVRDTICSGTSYLLPDGVIATNAGVYTSTLIAASASGCDSIITTILAGSNSYEQTLNYSICKGDSLKLPDGTIVRTEGLYSVYFLTQTGCDSVINFDVKLAAQGELQMANSFTPNNDGYNDCFGLRQLVLTTNIKFEIYTRWGQVIYSSNSPNACWDGTSKGAPAPIGTYVWALTTKTACGDRQQKGTIVLIR